MKIFASSILDPRLREGVEALQRVRSALSDIIDDPEGAFEQLDDWNPLEGGKNQDLAKLYDRVQGFNAKAQLAIATAIEHIDESLDSIFEYEG